MTLDILLESILVDSDYEPDLVIMVTDLESLAYEDSPEGWWAAKANEVLANIVTWIEARYDYSSDGGERPFVGAASILQDCRYYIETH